LAIPAERLLESHPTEPVPALVNAVFFSHVSTYVLVSAIGLALGVAALVRGHPGWLGRLWALILVLAVVAFPWIYRYQPALGAAPGYEMQIVTQPGFFGGVVKMSQIGLEERPCQYELLGWSADHRLYYQATCGAETQSWYYDPSQDDGARQVAAVPDTLGQASISEDSALRMVRARGVWPQDLEPVTRPILLRSQGYVSPDGRWTAMITQHVYGPQDVVLLARPD